MITTDDIVTQVRSDLQRALAAAEKARAALTTAEAQVSELTTFLRTLERYAPAVVQHVSAERREHDENEAARWVAARGTNSRVLVDACMAAINAATRPLTIGELVDVCLEQGLRIGGRDLKSNLAGYLSRDPRMKSLGRSVGWAIVETEGAASAPASQEAAPSIITGGPNERTTLDHPDDVAAPNRSATSSAGAE